MTTSTTAKIIAHARERLGLNQSELARQLDVSPQAVQAWESGRSIPRPKKLIEISKALQIPAPVLLKASGLLSGNVPDILDQFDISKSVLATEVDDVLDFLKGGTQAESDEVLAPFLKEVEISAGSGRTSIEMSRNPTQRLGKEMLRNAGVQSQNAVCINVQGDSMTPILPDGSTVGVDTGSTVVRDGKTYAINQSGHLRIKTLHRLPDGGIRLRSFNRDEYPDEEYSLEEMDQRDISIIGRVFWSSVLW